METVIQLKHGGIFIATGNRQGSHMEICAQNFYPMTKPLGFDFALPDSTRMSHLLRSYEAKFGIKINALHWVLTNGIDEIDEEYLPITNEVELKSYLRMNEEAIPYQDIQYQFLDKKCLFTKIKGNQRQLKAIKKLCGEVNRSLGWVDLDENSFGKWLWPDESERNGIVFVLRKNGLWAMAFHHGLIAASSTSYKNILACRESEQIELDRMMQQNDALDIFGEKEFDKPFRIRMEEAIYALFNRIYSDIHDRLSEEVDVYYVDEVFNQSETLQTHIAEYCKLQFNPLPKVWHGMPLEVNDILWLSVLGGLLRD